MKTAKIFNGERLIDVQEGSTFTVSGPPKWNVGALITFSVRSDIAVHTVVKDTSMRETTFLVTDIESKDELSEIEVKAEDVDFETDFELQDKAVEKPKFTKTKFTKKDLIEFIESNEIDVDINMTKANIVNALIDLDYI